MIIQKLYSDKYILQRDYSETQKRSNFVNTILVDKKARHSIIILFYRHKKKLKYDPLVNTDDQRIILFPGHYHEPRFGNEDIPFHMLKSQFLNDYDVALKHLNEQYGLSKVDYILYHPNLLINDKYIGYY